MNLQKQCPICKINLVVKFTSTTYKQFTCENLFIRGKNHYEYAIYSSIINNINPYDENLILLLNNKVYIIYNNEIGFYILLDDYDNTEIYSSKANLTIDENIENKIKTILTFI